MASAYPLPQSDPRGSLRDADLDQHGTSPFRNRQASDADGAAPFTSPTLSRINSESLSPSIVHLETPSGSSDTPGYQASDFSDLEPDEDPFFGANFNNLSSGAPAFLDSDVAWDASVFPPDESALEQAQHNGLGSSLYPLTPDHSSTLHTVSPSDRTSDCADAPANANLPTSVSPSELQKPSNRPTISTQTSQLTPNGTNSGRSSEDGLAPFPVTMPIQSPRVTVSIYGHDDAAAPIHTIERSFDDSSTVRGGLASAGDLISTSRPASPNSARRDSIGQWQPNPYTGQGGIDPRSRPAEETPSINELAAKNKLDRRNEAVGQWIQQSLDDVSVPREKSADDIRAIEQPHDNGSDDGIPLGHTTENKLLDGQTYFDSNGGPMTQEDYDIIYSDRNWGDAPMAHPIVSGTPGRFQPETSQAAIERFERMLQDNSSILSRSATWGTRRRSFPPLTDVEGVTSGNFLKKLSISRGDGKKNSKAGGLLHEIRGMMRNSSSSLRKRSRSRSKSVQEEVPKQHDETPRHSEDRRESSPHLSPTSRTSSWGKQGTPSINTALASIAQPLASIGATHARSGSISGGSSLISPKGGAFSTLSVKNVLRRPRSKSELPKSTAGMAASDAAPSALAGLWKSSGGPPVAQLSKGSDPQADDDEDDDDDDMLEDAEMKKNPNLIDDVSHDFAGFQRHVLLLNPGLATQSSYLVDRIAQQQVIRYKHLLNSKVKHLGLGANCPCGSLCLALGGSANVLDQRGDARGMDPLSTRFDVDGDATPTEGHVTSESFPQDIPAPPTEYLPAEFECQLCYQRKKFQKPSDWTKHVHEDVQPFTCTWDRCKDPKMFKRKADWVRHENEGHRHLEWWTCDVDDCRHTCYRKDNFLQHLVREHKFIEPKVKTKAAMKRAGGVEPTWQKVEQCHIETPKRPQDEPCKFCGRLFPTWKKLTVHLAKHMEQISLPVLRLVAMKAKELAADTIISPVQDPPPRQNFPLPNDPVALAGGMYSGQQGQQQLHPQNAQMSYHNLGQYMYPMQNGGQPGLQQQFYDQQYGGMAPTVQQHSPMNQAYNENKGMAGSGPYMQDMQNMQNRSSYTAMNEGGLEPFPQLDGLGLQGVPGGGLGAGQMVYDPGMLGPSTSVNGSPFSGHETLSTYSHSPHMNAVNQDDRLWDEQRMRGFS